jgi:phosphoglycolate phosphatase-like HAD superfamily hydrolase
MLLLLFDVDGTLLLSHDPLVSRATAAAAHEVWGVDVDDDALTNLDHPGRTALRHGRELLRAAGVPQHAVEDGLPRWCRRLGDRYVELLACADTSGWRVAEHARETLSSAAGHARLALLTGNPEPVARARMERLRLDPFFPRGQGAFGCEAEERSRLIELARERAGGWPAPDTVAIGDTPDDVAGARAAGIHVVALLSGRYDADALAGADAVISGLAALPEALEALRSSRRLR